MPAIITHDQFAQEMLKKPSTHFLSTDEEIYAFLLGSQGPDPLFFCVISPILAPYRGLGSLMHSELPSHLLANISRVANLAPTKAKNVVQAFSAGLMCHYLLDRQAHPFVYAQQYALCEAGIEGLDKRDGHEVHAVIESELDEMMLFTRTGRTVATYKPYKEILRASNQTLAALSHAIGTILWNTYQKAAPADLFEKSVRNYRLIQRATYSPRGIRRNLYGKIERLRRRHSFAQAFCHRPLALHESSFDNHEHEAWINPFTQEVQTSSFIDIFNHALAEADTYIPRLITQELSVEEAVEITRNLNYSGKPVQE